MTKRGRPPNVAVVLTTRMGSERQFGKVFADVVGKPLIYWITQRLDEIGKVIIGTTTDPQNDVLEQWGKDNGYPVYRHPDESDVVARVMAAVEQYHPTAQFIMRGLNDCPFIVPEFANRAVSLMKQYSGDSMYWVLPPFQEALYGATEFPRSRHAWDIIAANAQGDEREHPDIYFHRNRDKFNVIYHEPPPARYFRPYRLEVDWKEDLELVCKLSEVYGRLPTMEEAIATLDRDDTLYKINRMRIEKTGMSVSYLQHDRQRWWTLIRGKSIVMWDDTTWDFGEDGEPIFCKAKACLLGVVRKGKLYQKDVVIEGDAFIKCPCGAGRRWQEKA